MHLPDESEHKGPTEATEPPGADLSRIASRYMKSPRTPAPAVVPWVWRQSVSRKALTYPARVRKFAYIPSNETILSRRERVRMRVTCDGTHAEPPAAPTLKNPQRTALGCSQRVRR